MRGIQVNGDALRRLRKAKAMSQEDLAGVCGCSPRTVQNAERGKPMDAATLSLFTEALGAPLEQLLPESDAVAQQGNREEQARNIEVIQMWVAAFLAADVQKMVSLHHPEVLIELPGTEDLPSESGAGNFQGLEGVREHFEGVFSAFEPLETKDDTYDAKGAVVFHRCTMSSRNRVTGYVITARYFNEFELRDGLIVRRMTISDLTEHRRSFEAEG